MAVEERKALDPVVIDLKGIASFTDAFLVCTGQQRRQTQAICDAVVDRLREEGVRAIHVEGYALGDWILVDFADLVVHIFTPATRDFYGLERLWGDATHVRPEAAPIRARAKPGPARGKRSPARPQRRATRKG
jgi:ribosome-associated protein